MHILVNKQLVFWYNCSANQPKEKHMFSEIYDQFIAEHRRRNIELGFVFTGNSFAENAKLKHKHHLTLHHIMPKCIGGTNHLSNFVYLNQDDHRFAHMILGLSFIEMHKTLNEINKVSISGLFNPTCINKLFNEFPEVKNSIRFTILTFDNVRLSLTPNEAAMMVCFKCGISPLNPKNINKSLARLFYTVYGMKSRIGSGNAFGHEVNIEWKKNKKFIRMNKR